MWILYLLVFFVIILLVFLFEIRLRKPDQIVLYEKNNQVMQRRGRFYPRHFSLSLPKTIHSFALETATEAQGQITLKFKLAVSISASVEHLSALIRVGGWNREAVQKAAKELEVYLVSLIKAYAEQYAVEAITARQLPEFLIEQVAKTDARLGVEVITLTVQSIEPADEEIAEAIQQRETARILEQTESIKQQARVTAAKNKIKADEAIAEAEHELELKKFDLKEIKEKKAAALSLARVADELKASEMRLEFEQKEMALMKQNPELLMLSPQMTRLAEASQNLRNAKTIVSLSPNDLARGSKILDMLQTFMANILNNARTSQPTDAQQKHE